MAQRRQQESDPTKIAIFGSTGPAGLHLTKQALALEYKTSLFVRNPQKLPAEITSNPNVTIIKGDFEASDCEEKLTQAMRDCSAVLSMLGPVIGQPKDRNVISIATKKIIEVMKQLGIKRLICLGTISMRDPRDNSSCIPSFLVTMVRTFFGFAYRDIVSVGLTVSNSDLDWTIVRVAVLRNSRKFPNKASWNVGRVGDGKTGWKVERADFAAFMLEELKQKEWVRKMPYIST